MKTIKLDARYNGFTRFRYMAKCDHTEQELFCQIRQWCWEQWGPSCEQSLISFLEEKPTKWSWDSEHGNLRVLMATEKEYQWFLLKWV
jgi:hypothetical protein